MAHEIFQDEFAFLDSFKQHGWFFGGMGFVSPFA
jgi:hypothetical protein